MVRTRMVLPFLAAMAALTAARAAADAPRISDGVVKIGVMNDATGPYADAAGQGSFIAATMAVEDFGGKVLGAPVEVIYGDHQNKPDVAASKARQWFDREQVDVIADVPTSSCTLAVSKIATAANRVLIVSGGGSSRLTNEDCAETTLQWTYDTFALAAGTARSVVAQGGKRWFFLTADYAFGHSLEKDASEFVRAAGGAVVGSARYPFPGTHDFASFLLQAQGSGAQVIGLANAGADTINAIKQAAQFDVTRTQRLAPLLFFINDVHAVGLEAAQGTYLTAGFYWDLDDESRAFARRFQARHKVPPNMIQAGVYSGVLHYLKAVAAAGTDEAHAVVAMMRKLPVRDAFARHGTLRPDGRMIHDMYLMEVKSPAASRGPWDYFVVRKVIPAAEAFQSLDRSLCPLLKR